MIISEATKLYPGSPEAIAKGCTCQVNPSDPDSFLIESHCPLHWHMNLVAKTQDIHKNMLSIMYENKNLYYCLIALSIGCGLILWGSKL